MESNIRFMSPDQGINRELERVSLEIGSVLSSKKFKYRIISVLGRGSFGITYSAVVSNRKNKEEKVCIKEFFIQGVSSREDSGIISYCSDTVAIDQCRDEFIAEAKNLIELNHPNIVKAHELFEANGTWYYSMDYIEGENLNSYLSHAHLDVKSATKIITRVAYALSYMHESRHMLHLDLKPGNIMRRASDGQVILIDFGLSRFFTEEGAPETASQIGLGTRGYAPVEQTKFNSRKQEFKATIDVYALGATYYKLITGQTPLVSREYKESPSLLVESLNSLNIPNKTISIIAKAMNPLPEARYQTVMSFIYDLDSDERERRNKGCISSIACLLLVLLLTFVFIKIYSNHKTAKEDYYNSVDDYAFELVEYNSGANHYGETEYYKFFTNGTGLYLFIAWHDTSECDGECDLSAQTDTLTFKYSVNGNTISYPRWIKSVMNGKPEQELIFINPVCQTIVLGEKDNRYIDPEKIDWNKVYEILK